MVIILQIFALVSSWCPLFSCYNEHSSPLTPSLQSWSCSLSRWSEGLFPTLQVLAYFHVLICTANLMPSAHFLGAFDQSSKLNFFHQVKGFLMVEASCQTGGFPRMWKMISQLNRLPYWQHCPPSQIGGIPITLISLLGPGGLRFVDIRV